MPFAVAVSEHPVPAQAVGEVGGRLIELLDGSPTDLLVVFVTRAHAGAMEDIASALGTLLSPTTTLACTAVSIAAGDREVEESAAIVAWAASGIGPVKQVRLAAKRGPFGPGGEDAFGISGWPTPEAIGFEPTALLLAADPFTFPVETLLSHLEHHWPGLPVIGGMASAAMGPGGNRLATAERTYSDGAVGVLVGGGVKVTPLVSQGCRPIGQPYVVTRSEHTAVAEMGGKPALRRLLDLAESGGLTEREIMIVNQGGLHLGVVIDERKTDFGTGDFLVRNVLGADQETGAIDVGHLVEVGTTVQYHLRDAVAADQDLRDAIDGKRADGALLFTCNGRGRRLFGVDDHDAEVVSAALQPTDPPLAGMFAAGELGPVGGRNFVHGFTASIALFEHI